MSYNSRYIERLSDLGGRYGHSQSKTNCSVTPPTKNHLSNSHKSDIYSSIRKKYNDVNSFLETLPPSRTLNYPPRPQSNQSFYRQENT